MVVALWGREQLTEDSAVTDAGGYGGVTLAYNARGREEVDAVIEEARAAGATDRPRARRDLLGRVLGRVRRPRRPSVGGRAQPALDRGRGRSRDGSGPRPAASERRAIAAHRRRQQRRRAARRRRLDRSEKTGGVLLSQALASQVPSALRGLTALFGMGRGVSPSLKPPENGERPRPSTVLQNCTAATAGITCLMAEKNPSSPRPISTGLLQTLPSFQIRPINLVVYQGSYSL